MPRDRRVTDTSRQLYSKKPLISSIHTCPLIDPCCINNSIQTYSDPCVHARASVARQGSNTHTHTHTNTHTQTHNGLRLHEMAKQQLAKQDERKVPEMTTREIFQEFEFSCKVLLLPSFPSSSILSSLPPLSLLFLCNTCWLVFSP